jgi:hypothetical protein
VWPEFVKTLVNADGPRFAVIDFHYTTKDGRIQRSLVSVGWCPDKGTPAKQKMVFGSTKTGFEQKINIGKKVGSAHISDRSLARAPDWCQCSPSSPFCPASFASFSCVCSTRPTTSLISSMPPCSRSCRPSKGDYCCCTRHCLSACNSAAGSVHEHVRRRLATDTTEDARRALRSLQQGTSCRSLKHAHT